jgi:hypothetical protein
MPSSPNFNNSSSGVRSLFRTPRNTFGLFRRYTAEKPPSHDPEVHLDLQDLSNRPSAADVISSHSPPDDVSFYPYPNKSSFLLGEWYWNGGIQKSRESFNSLVAIVGDPQFCSEDVQHTNWITINTKLGANGFDSDMPMDDEVEWVNKDAGWKKTSISISVPFHKRATKPGPWDFVVGDLYHRPFVSVIREKLANSQDMQHFHLEPFELFWRPSDAAPDVQVHGELYTSPAFVKAHRELQNMPGEPGCTLPWVVVALMFWSDGTQMTSYGTAQLWPGYLCFGNESKYRRCKPTNHLCNHVAYFLGVSLPFCVVCFSCSDI